MRSIGWLALLLTTVIATPAAGQFGLRGGVNLTRFIGDDASNVETKQGLNFGGSFRLFGIGPVSIVPEVFYSQKGATIDQTGSQATPRQFEFSLAYLEVPVLARLNLPPLNIIQPYFAAGPAFAWQLDCELSMTEGGATSAVEECGDQFGGVDTAFKDADRGVVVSGGIDLMLFGAGGLNLEARVVRGLARLSEGPGEGEGDVRNQSVSLMLGYSFGM